MIEFFVNKILSSNPNERITIDDVPELWREQVKAELEKLKNEKGSEMNELYT